MNEDETLDKVIALWKQADTLTDEVDRLEDEAKAKRDEAEVKQDQADELEAEAELLWKPLAEQHPEWFDHLITGIDPRTGDKP